MRLCARAALNERLTPSLTTVATLLAPFVLFRAQRRNCGSLANKSDRVSSVVGLDIAKGLDMSMIRGRYWEVVETSTVQRDDVGIQEGVDWLVYVLGKKMKPTQRRGAPRSGASAASRSADDAASDSVSESGSGSGDEDDDTD